MKTYLQTVDFDHDKESLMGALGAESSRLVEAESFLSDLGDGTTSYSEALEALLDAGILQGGDIVYCLYKVLLQPGVSSARYEEFVQAIFGAMIDDEGDDDEDDNDD